MENLIRKVAIIQARMGSDRLPGKVLEKIGGIPLLEILMTRINQSKLLDEIIVATTLSKKDDILCKWLDDNQVRYFRGSEKNVLKRFYDCIANLSDKPDLIVRLTADDPFKDPELIDKAIKIIIESKNIDYVSNTLNPTYPEGLDVEVFTYDSLKKAFSKARLESEKEHVTPYIWKNSKIFNIVNFEMQPNLSHWRWTIDKPEDLKFANLLMELASNDINIGYRDLIKITNKNRYIININAGIPRNEGYKKSIKYETSK